MQRKAGRGCLAIPQEVGEFTQCGGACLSGEQYSRLVSVSSARRSELTLKADRAGIFRRIKTLTALLLSLFTPYMDLLGLEFRRRTSMTNKSDSSLLLSLGCLFGGFAVAAGAFGAHALKGVLDAQMLIVFETAARYGPLHSGVGCRPISRETA